MEAKPNKLSLSAVRRTFLFEGGMVAKILYRGACIGTIHGHLYGETIAGPYTKYGLARIVPNSLIIAKEEE